MRPGQRRWLHRLPNFNVIDHSSHSYCHTLGRSCHVLNCFSPYALQAAICLGFSESNQWYPEQIVVPPWVWRGFEVDGGSSRSRGFCHERDSERGAVERYSGQANQRGGEQILVAFSWTKGMFARMFEYVFLENYRKRQAMLAGGRSYQGKL
jgi:hypothetical protein